MAYQAGPLRLKGKLGDLSFYFNKQHGYLVRQKSGPSKEQVASSPQFVRTRENAAEFSLAVSSGQLIRRAILSSSGLRGDSTVSQRLTGLLVSLGKNDLSVPRGMRSVVHVFDESVSKEGMRSFAFYGNCPLTRVYKGQIACNTETGTVAFTGPVSSGLFHSPIGSTHVRINAFLIALDFAGRTFSTSSAPAYVAALEDSMVSPDFTCDPGTLPEPAHRMGIVSIEFLQEKNGVLYLHHEGMCLGIVG